LRRDDKTKRFFNVVQSAHLNVGAIWTPDGKSLAYIADNGKEGNVWIQPIKGGRPRQLTDFTSGWIYRIAYSADGKRLYLARGFAVNDALLVSGFAE
jgi:Tol biopolymer transport system component